MTSRHVKKKITLGALRGSSLPAMKLLKKTPLLTVMLILMLGSIVGSISVLFEQKKIEVDSTTLTQSDLLSTMTATENSTIEEQSNKTYGHTANKNSTTITVVSSSTGTNITNTAVTDAVISNEEEDNLQSVVIQHNKNDILDELDLLSGGPEAKTLECPEPLVPFQNIIVRNNDTANSEDGPKIPRILHLSMKSRCLPRDLARTVDRWSEVLPKYSIFFHDDDAVARLIENNAWEEFPNLHRAMKCVMYKGAMKIDVWRVLMLYKYGGVYTDIDNYPTQSFDESTIRSDLSAFFLKDGYNRPSQWFMATEPRHPIMYLSMIDIIENIFNIPNIRRPKVVFVTGPHAVKGGYQQFVKNGDDTMSDKLVFANDVVVKGMHNMTALKSTRTDILTSKDGYDDIVPFNSTLNVTRRERLEMDGGVMHWQYTIHRSASKIPNVSCKGYLEHLDKGTLEEVQQF